MGPKGLKEEDNNFGRKERISLDKAGWRFGHSGREGDGACKWCRASGILIRIGSEQPAVCMGTGKTAQTPAPVYHYNYMYILDTCTLQRYLHYYAKSCVTMRTVDSALSNVVVSVLMRFIDRTTCVSINMGNTLQIHVHVCTVYTCTYTYM